MTPDGRWIVFESAANDLVAADPGDNDLFIRDAHAGVTRLVTERERVLAPAQGSRFYSSSVSTNGGRVAFVSTAINLRPLLSNRNGDVWMRDVSGETNFWASSNLAAYFRTEEYRCLNSLISGDGQQVAFKAAAFETSPVHLFIRQIDTGVTTAIATNCRPDTLAAFSSDGRWIAYEENNAIYLRDLVNSTNLLISVNSSSNVLGGVSLRPVITPDARHVAFISIILTTNVIPQLLPYTSVSHIYVRALGGGNTTVVWSAVVGRDYVVQFKDSLDANWTNASGVIEANSTSMSFAHNSSSPQRFYRVLAVQ